ncbi:tetratricopeptide repeat protein [Solimonas sp. K1W22B-7]|uniref:tetratricopeptide repeat protein n=1 Tax=Solimonas sp. K1W22B-7 TaxID=2303331 RepID=UPI000E32D53D|nr:tetratricopeptide repeat protein [Solimonas sp. K1W22B-7]AXQ27566.1 tetratricopeptide repeat protein [Solimonas sp. K1W22B-7]
MSPVAQARSEVIKRLLRDGKYAAALVILDQKLAEQPDLAPLHWHRSSCLMMLGRPAEALAAVLRVIELQSDFAKAWLRRAELTATLHGDYPEREGDLRLATALDSELAPAHRALALIHQQAGRLAEAEASLSRALELDPSDGEGYAIRAWWASNASRALAAGEETVAQPNGTQLSRRRLEGAVEDLRRAVRLVADAARYRMQLARRLQELQRFGEAVAEYDELLASLPAGHVLRNVAEEMRRLAWAQGAGERTRAAQQQAQLQTQIRARAQAEALEAAAAAQAEGARRTVEQDLAASVLRSSAQQLRQGKDLSAVLEPLGDGSPDTLLAINVADKLFQLGHLPPCELRPAPAEAFPEFMRRHAAESWQQLAMLGFVYLGDFDPRHLAPLLSESTLLRCYRSGDGSVAANSYAVRPNRAGWVGWLRLRLARLPRSVGVMEFETEFADGGFVVTNNGGNANPFAHGSRVDTLALPAGSRADFLFERHRRRCADYLRQHTGVGVRELDDLPGLVAMQDRLAETKNEYRQSIGYASDEELQRLLGSREDLADRVREQLARLAAS